MAFATEEAEDPFKETPAPPAQVLVAQDGAADPAPLPADGEALAADPAPLAEPAPATLTDPAADGPGLLPPDGGPADAGDGALPETGRGDDGEEPDPELVDMYRLYNPNTGEHFYTGSADERDGVAAAGWSFEGVGWVAPVTSSTPVFRLYNAVGGEHHYTTSEGERDGLVSFGWSYEGVGWYSDDGRTIAVLRQYNPNAFSCNHNFTTSASEDSGLAALGWRSEGTAWYAAAEGGKAWEDPTISYRTQSHGYGWADWITSGYSGGTGQVEQVQAQVSGWAMSGGVTSRVYSDGAGWGNFVDQAGGEGLRAEALQMRLDGQLSSYYDVWYRVHLQNVGWLGWAKNGEVAGAPGAGLRVEVIEVCLRSRTQPAPGPTADHEFTGGKLGYQNPSNMYQLSAHSVNVPQGHGKFDYATPSRISLTASRDEVVNAFLQRAEEYVGTPYVWDYACAPGVGVDCAGLVLQCGYAVGMDFGDMNPYNHYYTPGHDQYANRMWNDPKIQHVSLAARQPGDLISYAGHVAIYTGNNTVIEAWPKAGVRHASMTGDGHGAVRGVMRLFS